MHLFLKYTVTFRDAVTFAGTSQKFNEITLLMITLRYLRLMKERKWRVGRGQLEKLTVAHETK